MGLVDRVLNIQTPENHQVLIDDLKRIVVDLTHVSGKIRIVLFGSQALGKAILGSDIDILVLLDDSLDKKIFKHDFFHSKKIYKHPVDYIFKYSHEFESESFLLSEIIEKEGIELYPRWSFK